MMFTRKKKLINEKLPYEYTLLQIIIDTMNLYE